MSVRTPSERQLLIAAIERHTAGDLRQAEELYSQIVRLNRRNYEALHRWALAKQARGDYRQALQLLEKAISINPHSPFAHCHRGYILQDLGRHQEAITSVTRAIRLKRDFVDAHIALGILHAEQGDIAKACACFDKASEIDPCATDALLNKGLLFERRGRLDEAIATFDAALQVAPTDLGLLCRKAACLRQKGRFAGAIDICDAALALKRDHAPIVFERGLALAETGNHADALAAFQSAADLGHEVDACFCNIGNSLRQVGQPRGARAAYQHAITLRPDSLDAFNGLGHVFSALGQPLEALGAFDRALSIKPNDSEALTSRADTLLWLNRTTEALATYERAIEASSGSADVLNSRGNAFQALGRYEEAIVSYRKALTIDSNHGHALHNMGNALRFLDRYDEAIGHYAQAIAIKPDLAEAYFSEAMCRLEMGDWIAGWKLHEWRWQTPHLKGAQREYRQPLWTGETDVSGRTILVWAEQGYGDTIQFVRYAPLLHARGARVILEVQAELAPLLSRMAGGTTVLARGEELPEFDLHCPMMSLPLAFETTLDTIPASIPYLNADAAQVDCWQERLSGISGLKVGIVWSGNPRSENATHHLTDKRRSMVLSQMTPFGSVPHVSLISLQKGRASQQALEPIPGLTVQDWTDELHDFADTAALVEALDLVISVDTSVAHLVGALGKPVWVLDRYDSCWRWLAARDDSPWYPSMRLFRQEKPGDWPTVVEKVRAELEAFGDSRSPKGC